MEHAVFVGKRYMVSGNRIAILLILLFFSACAEVPREKSIRSPAIAGSWYPGAEAELSKEVLGFFDNVDKIELNGKIRALIVPHAGYRYSGQTAAWGFAQIEDIYDTVIIIAPSHRASFTGASIGNFTHYRTPLGEIQLSEKAYELLKEDNFQSHPSAHREEHAIEIELPFLQLVWKDFELIPILIGSMTTNDQLKEIAETLENYVDDKTLIIISSDFTHYGPNYGYIPFKDNLKENLEKMDGTAVAIIKEKDTENFIKFLEETKDTICGRAGITILLYMYEDKKNIQSIPITYTTSGAITGDYTNSVSYLTIAFVETKSVDLATEELLNKDEQEFLLNLARDTLEEYLQTGKKIDVDEEKLTPALKKVQGCFTTLNKNEQLRGCIGHIIPQEELYKCVQDNAINAAVNDMRFSKVKYQELESIEVEISVLTVPEEIDYIGDDLLTNLRPMVDGVVLKQGVRSSTYLPQVWSHFQTSEKFLTSLCQKGGMSATCWKEQSTTVSTYQAFVFEEH